ncbi:hypothetical protein M7I_5154 [Glarea lozoyensis 74030]|uniref:Uncharacterized protein n=1 Tax=Glarea lozoyensis (strain ATCC 74030 / MF5533) TaxID=1104152 RepID=H0ER39_GLAL7|nr:hypothetical protein M7I_5154 [Glarea lozoyensis 74030]
MENQTSSSELTIEERIDDAYDALFALSDITDAKDFESDELVGSGSDESWEDIQVPSPVHSVRKEHKSGEPSYKAIKQALIQARAELEEHKRGEKKRDETLMEIRGYYAIIKARYLALEQEKEDSQNAQLTPLSTPNDEENMIETLQKKLVEQNGKLIVAESNARCEAREAKRQAKVNAKRWDNASKQYQALAAENVALQLANSIQKDTVSELQKKLQDLTPTTPTKIQVASPASEDETESFSMPPIISICQMCQQELLSLGDNMIDYA